MENGVNWRFNISNISTCVCPLFSLNFAEPVQDFKQQLNLLKNLLNFIYPVVELTVLGTTGCLITPGFRFIVQASWQAEHFGTVQFEDDLNLVTISGQIVVPNPILFIDLFYLISSWIWYINITIFQFQRSSLFFGAENYYFIKPYTWTAYLRVVFKICFHRLFKRTRNSYFNFSENPKRI